MADLLVIIFTRQIPGLFQQGLMVKQRGVLFFIFAS